MGRGAAIAGLFPCQVHCCLEIAEALAPKVQAPVAAPGPGVQSTQAQGPQNSHGSRCPPPSPASTHSLASAPLPPGSAFAFMDVEGQAMDVKGSLLSHF